MAIHTSLKQGVNESVSIFKLNHYLNEA
jgi:hypothetical protein